MPRTLLTGASGYLGLHTLTALLAAGQEVTALVREPARLGPLRGHPRLQVQQADLEDTPRVAAALAGHGVVVHAALIWGPPGEDLALRDTAAAARLFEAAGLAGVARCVLVSSAAVHRPFTALMGEDDALRTADPYGATKAAGELFLRAACAAHGMSGVAVRPGPIVGPPAFPGGAFRSDGRIAALATAARQGLPLRVVRGEGRQLSDVGVVARTLTRLTTLPEPAPTYLCMESAPTPWEQVARWAIAAARSPSALVVEEGEASPPPRFRVDRLEALLGGPTEARPALQAHLLHLLGNTAPASGA